MVNKNKFAKEDNQGYRVNITGRNVLVTEAMKHYAMEKISKIDRFHNHVFEVHVTMDIQKLEHSVIIILNFSHFKIKVSAETADLYVSIDKAVEKLQAQLRRWKGKIQDHHKKGLSVIDMTVNVLQRPYSDLDEINAAIETVNLQKETETYNPPKIIGSETKPLKMLTMDEAVMKIELSGDHFMLFRSEEDQKLKLIYRRSDGHYGIILPE